jgi:hypothetical protein
MDISNFVHYGTGSRIPPLTASLATRIIRNNVIILGMSSGLDFSISTSVEQCARWHRGHGAFPALAFDPHREAPAALELAP